MLKNELNKNYDIAIVGGGLTGKLMVTMLTNCTLFDKNKLCWINTEKNNNKDRRVSFINYKNFVKLEVSVMGV